MITKSAVNIDTFRLNGFFTKNARSAWGHIIKNLSGARPQKILLPAYIGFTEREGSGVFDPVVDNKSDYAFYKIMSNLSVDLEDFKLQLADRVDIVLVIHYFGFCRSDMGVIKQLCLNANVVLVEDCAHAFYLEASNSPLGQIGDFSFYSLHKYIATDSGGILKVNNKELVIKAMSQKDLADPKVVEQYALSDFEAIKNIRRQNFTLYCSLLASLDQVEIMFDLSEGDIPQTFPIRIKNSKREALYFYLMERDIPTTALYYRMIDEIDFNKHSESLAISSQILNLPVHQDTTAKDVHLVCNCIIDFYR